VNKTEIITKDDTKKTGSYESLAELVADLGELDKKATTFEKTEVLGIKPGQSFQVRIGKVIETKKYDTNLIILSEFSLLNEEDGTAGPIQKVERRLDSFIVRRAKEKEVPLVKGLVYFIRYISEVETAGGLAPFKMAYVKLIGTEFLKK